MVAEPDYRGDVEQVSNVEGGLSGTLTPLLFQEGFNIGHDGNMTITWHVDFRTPHERSPIGPLIKCCETEFAIERCKTVKLAKPSHFRQEGETLIYDPREGLATIETSVRCEVPIPDSEQARIRLLGNDVNRALRLAGQEGITVGDTGKSEAIVHTNRDSLEWGKDTWIFCAAMKPTSDAEKEALRESLDPGYDHESHIPSPRTFAQTLARAYVEEYGAPYDPKGPMAHTIDGAFIGNTYHRYVVVIHGPVLYVDDPHAICSSALATQNPLAKLVLPIFVKAKEYSGQREYRFVISDKAQHGTDWKIMPAPPMLVAAIGQRGDSGKTMVVPDFDTTGVEIIASPDSTDSTPFPHVPSPPVTVAAMPELNPDFPTILDRFRTANEEEPTNDFLETVGLYPAVATLHEKIDGVFMGMAAAQPERKPYLTSAAWYAERSIRKLCHRFENPIVGISVTNDNSIVIDIRLSHWRDSKCRLAVMPSGVYALTLKDKNGEVRASDYSGHQWGDRRMATSLGDWDLDSIADFEPPTGPGY